MQDAEMTLEPTEAMRLCVWQRVGLEKLYKQEIRICVWCENEDRLSVSFQVTDESKDDIVVEVLNGRLIVTEKP